MKFENWSRVNPKRISKIKLAMIDNLFDGDHAICNSFTVRSNRTIEEVIKGTEEREAGIKAEKELKERMVTFKSSATNGAISINLKDVNDELFFESVHVNEFWRVAFEIHQRQNSL